MTNTASMAAKNGVQPTVSLPNVQTAWHNIFDADRPAVDISPVRSFSDGIARDSWTVYPVALGGTVTTFTGVLEGTMDGTNFYTIGTMSAAGTVVDVQNISAKHFRVRVTSCTLGTGYGYRVGVVASGS